MCTRLSIMQKEVNLRVFAVGFFLHVYAVSVLPCSLFFKFSGNGTLCILFVLGTDQEYEYLSCYDSQEH